MSEGVSFVSMKARAEQAEKQLAYERSTIEGLRGDRDRLEKQLALEVDAKDAAIKLWNDCGAELLVAEKQLDDRDNELLELKKQLAEVTLELSVAREHLALRGARLERK